MNRLFVPDSAHVDSPAQRLRDRPRLEREVDKRQQEIFATIAEKMVRLKLAGLTPVDVRIHVELAKKAEITNLDMLYALPVVTTVLYREQGVVVTGAWF